ncbi:uncharacterized protein Z520_03403 [Fonsecaea multimorphosa CBS 102226]|uniref:FAD-binding domain-containing protein n=1 Tax=Fonsecaea multimorphosa CBS 102226 TaxID=1442371 RepID=A0A0D2K4J3_9EURO|nr:uncharacterized protein Z520_03403 [Fonsecaea multimorphosa CBS 102226]KIY00738.1 hypothetical protein Z520_03403 [Fonsecaea multimorphosa CBS 102226]OAL27782.1 hypothetical protein AYO22_03324 [Fonsecaea multimorphosa]
MAKIIIIGAGISGLSTYLFLRKHLVLSDSTPSPQAEQQRPQQQQYEIKIYEAYDIHQSHFNASLTNPAVDTDANEESTTANAVPATETEPIFTPQAIGAAIGIARNGLNVLARLDETHDHGRSEAQAARSSTLIEEMAVHGHPIERWILSTARGFTLGEIDLAGPGTATTASKPSVNKHERSKSPPAAARNPCPYHGIMIARQSFWEILRDRVLRESPDVVIRKKVVDVVIGNEGTRNLVKFEDGSQEEADLVIGADGLRSVLRRAMFRKGKAAEDEGEGGVDNATTTDGAQTHDEQSSHNPTQKTTSNWLQTILSYLPIPFFRSGGDSKATQTDYVSPHYEGLVGVGGFVPSSALQATGHKPGTMTVVFGPNGFFGYGYLTSSRPPLPSPSPNRFPATRETETTSGLPPDLPTPAPGPLAGWWSTFSSPSPFPYSTPSSPSPGRLHNADTATNTNTSTTRTPTNFNKHLAQTALLHRHRNWHNPTIQAILSFVVQNDHTEQQRPQDQRTQTQLYGDDSPDGLRAGNSPALHAPYPTWTTPELPCWSLRGRAVLVGDAAHALQPSSGQGASQALEDAEALAVFLKRYLASASNPGSSNSGSNSNSSGDAPLSRPSHTALLQALTAFETLRMPRVHAIHARSQRMSRMKADMGVLAEWAMYAAIWAGMRFLRPGGDGEGEGGSADERYYDKLFGEVVVHTR